ncbi:N-acetylglucosamine-6-phosphate deacetylase [Pseudonocardiaceae bacterium YIM PH 21723]|nr:N-acetylglucosamine-6-phosphate deacetylase [Pseudonocardiaceae bacterium YIM PH 21723]
MYQLRNADLVLPDRVVTGGILRTERSEISGIDEPVQQGMQDVDLTDHWVVPGFVDLHVHGGGGHSYTTGDQDEARKVVEFHRRHGTTSSFASTVTADLDELARIVGSLAELVQDGLVAGIHLEGPFISEDRCGAHDPALLRAPDAASIDALLAAGRDTVRMVTIAAELPGGIDAVRRLTGQGVIAALGHTNATYDQAIAAIEAGVTVGTHLFNGMRPINHREGGPVTALLERDTVTVELINDGHHLSAETVELVLRTVGPERIALITDAMSAAGAGDGMYRLGPLDVQVRDGVAIIPETGSLAGSTLTMDAAFRRSVQVNGLSMVHAALAAATTPARVLGAGDRTGALSVGRLADLVVLDRDLHVVAVMVQGAWVPGTARSFG